MSADDLALAGLYVQVEEFAELLREVYDVLPGHLEQQEQALADGIAGAEAARQWIRAEGVRAVGKDRWLQLLEEASADVSVESTVPAVLVPQGPNVSAAVEHVVQLRRSTSVTASRDRRAEQLERWLRREQQSHARERARLYHLIGQLQLALRDAQRRGETR